ncbi:TetR/AcrR family transcriptional regulator [Haliangium sp.]|uniref:TetR/AcrR family transcriptional regulator n=1 Tax=Haliangium sp. TaxID=2663208 RepID=UPI003D0B1134
MTRTKSDDKRAAILDAAAALFSRYGYRRTSVDDVAGEAGIAKGTVYLYFDNKQALFAEVCRHVAHTFLDRAEAAVAQSGSVTETVQAVLAAKFCYLYQLVHSSPHASEIIQSKNQIAAEIFVDADRRYLELLRKLIARADRRGDLALAEVGIKPRAAATLLIRCAHGTGSGDPPGVRPELGEYERRLAEMTRVVLAGLGAAPA